jgi:hypothetical protein
MNMQALERQGKNRKLKESDLSQLDASFIPHWADEILKLKGLGFEVKGLDLLMWDYFVSQFGTMEVTDDELKYYFASVVDTLIKNGHVERGRRMLILERQEKATARQNAHVKPVKQSSLAEFDDKVADYLSENTDVPVSDAKHEHSHQTVERELLWGAYQALKTGSEEDRVAVLKTLDDYYEKIGQRAE